MVFEGSCTYTTDSQQSRSIQVHLASSLILNGVSVRWKGWIDLERLEGVGCIDFDEQMAKVRDFHQFFRT